MRADGRSRRKPRATGRCESRSTRSSTRCDPTPNLRAAGAIESKGSNLLTRRTCRDSAAWVRSRRLNRTTPFRRLLASTPGLRRSGRASVTRLAVRQHRCCARQAGVRQRRAGVAAEPDGRDSRGRDADNSRGNARGRLGPGSASHVEARHQCPDLRARICVVRRTAQGTLTNGMLADLVVLSDDIFESPGAQLASTPVAVTIFDGKIVYRRNAKSTN